MRWVPACAQLEGAVVRPWPRQVLPAHGPDSLHRCAHMHRRPSASRFGDEHHLVDRGEGGIVRDGVRAYDPVDAPSQCALGTVCDRVFGWLGRIKAARPMHVASQGRYDAPILLCVAAGTRKEQQLRPAQGYQGEVPRLRGRKGAKCEVEVLKRCHQGFVTNDGPRLVLARLGARVLSAASRSLLALSRSCPVAMPRRNTDRMAGASRRTCCCCCPRRVRQRGAKMRPEPGEGQEHERRDDAPRRGYAVLHTPMCVR